MKKTADITIIGGGVAGTSIAYHLARMGCENIVVLEKGLVGFGSTGKCAGGVRQQFSTEVNIRLSMESLRFFKNFEEITGHPADFHQNGYLLLARNEEELNGFREALQLQHKLGLESFLLFCEQINDILPDLNTENVSGGVYCPTDGFADPSSVVQGFASCAREMGVYIYEGTEVIDIELLDEGRIKKILTGKGVVEAPVLVNAAGAHAAEVGKMLGLDIPVFPSRRHIFFTEPFNGTLEESPMVIDFSTGFWFRREGSGFIFGMRNPEEKEGFNNSVDWDFLIDTLAPVAIDCFPPLAELGVQNAWAGLHADTPDRQTILGEVPEIEKIYLACGFSGHGFMHSPAVGKVMAEIILEKNPSIDVSSLSIRRFREASFQHQKEGMFI